MTGAVRTFALIDPHQGERLRPPETTTYALKGLIADDEE